MLNINKNNNYCYLLFRVEKSYTIITYVKDAVTYLSLKVIDDKYLYSKGHLEMYTP